MGQHIESLPTSFLASLTQQTAFEEWPILLTARLMAWAELQYRHCLFENLFFEGPPFSFAQLGFE
jgi:hypothetical protein